MQILNRITKLVRILFFVSSGCYPCLYSEGLLLTSSAKNIDSNKTSKLPVVEETNPATTSTVDLDNDYIEPESPTGADALIYDEEENDDDSNNRNTSPRPSTIHSPVETPEEVLPVQQIIRADYNPLKANNETTST